MQAPLSQLAAIKSGYQFRARIEDDPTGNVAVIQVKDLGEDLRLRLDGLERAQIDRAEPYLVRQGDVLFLARGARLRAAAIEDDLRGTIANGFFFILRPVPLVLPAFLAWSINARPFQEQLRPFVRGSHIPLVTRGDLEQIQIDVPPLETQRLIVALDEAQRREKYLQQVLEAKRAQLIEAVTQAAVKAEVYARAYTRNDKS